MNKSKVVFIISIFTAHLGYAQIQSNPNVVEFKSPQATQIEKVGLVGNSLQTGQINPSISIYTINTGELSIPINLSYSNTGLRIGENATWVGLGWNLFVGGLITQTVKGVPDNSPNGLIQPGANVNLLRYLNNQMALSEQKNYEYAVSTLDQDSERDIFNFNFLGNSGSFYFDANGVIRQFSRSDLKITYSQSTGFFSITDNKAFTYTFGTKEVTSFSQDDIMSNTPLIVNGNTWYLTSINTPLNDVITFQYEDGGSFNEISYPYSLTFGARIVSGAGQFAMCGVDNGLADIGIAQVFSTATEKHLKQITTSNGKVVFNMAALREDLTYVGSGGGKAKALDEILVQTNDGAVIQKTKFTYSHFLNVSSVPKNRLKLVKITTSDNAGSNTLDHTFAYYNENSIFPPLGLLSKDFDHWGYYNGAGNTTTIPTFNAGLVNGQAGQYNGADKNAKGIYSQYGMLKQIQYPTGGRASFEYEPNRINLSGNTTIPLFINTAGIANLASFEVGGNRIKTVTYYDYEQHEAYKQYFEYSEEADLKYTPNYLTPKTRINESYDGLGDIRNCGTFWVVSDRPVNSMPGSHIEYSSVIEKRQSSGDNGYVKTYFKKTTDWGSSVYPFPTIINSNWRSGITDVNEIYKQTAPGNYSIINKSTSGYTAGMSNPMLLEGSSAKITLDQVSLYNIDMANAPSRYIRAIYTYFTEDFKQNGTTEYTYTDNGQQTTANTFFYENPNHNQVTKQVTQNSKGNTETTVFKYPHDFATVQPYTEMINRNNVAPVIEQVQTNITLNKELARTKTNYQFWQNNTIVQLQSVQKSILGNPFDNEVVINAYDDKGNILETVGKDGIVTAYIWGYGKNYPVAKISNKPYADAVQQSGIDLAVVNAPVDDAAMRTELNKLRGLPDAFVTTYTYKPLIGITSETEPNGKTRYYEYDALMRLKMIKDQDGNTVKTFDYQHKTGVGY